MQLQKCIISYKVIDRIHIIKRDERNYSCRPKALRILGERVFKALRITEFILYKFYSLYVIQDIEYLSNFYININNNIFIEVDS